MAARRKAPDRNVLVDQAPTRRARKTAKNQSKGHARSQSGSLPRKYIVAFEEEEAEKQPRAGTGDRTQLWSALGTLAASCCCALCVKWLPGYYGGGLPRAVVAAAGVALSWTSAGYVRRYLGAEDDWYDRMGQRLS